METSIFRRTPERRGFSWSIVQPYALAVATSLVALFFSWLLEPYLQRFPLLLLFIAVLVSVWYGGGRAGILSTALTVLFAEMNHFAERSGSLPFPEKVSWVAFYTIVALASVGVLTQLRSRSAILREKDAQLTDFMEAATIGLQWLARDGTILWANPSMADLLGCRPEECVHRKFQDFMADAAAAQEVFQRLASNERLKNHEIRLRSLDGSIKTVLLDADVFWREGRFIHSRCFVRNITTRKNMEEALRRSEQRFRQLAESIQSVFWLWAPTDKEFLYVSPAYEKIWGRSPESLTRRPESFIETVHPEDRPAVQRKIAAQDAGEETLSEYRIIRPDGAMRWVRDRAFPLQDNRGRVYRIAGISEDITERKEAQLAMQEKEIKFRAIFEHSFDAIGVSHDGLLVMVNPALVRLYGCDSADELIGTPVSELVVKDERERVVAYAAQRQRGEAAPSNYLSRGIRRDGTELEIEVDVSTFELRGSPHILFMLRDVTARRKAEESLRKSEHSLRLAQRIGRIGSWEADLNRDTLDWSEETYRIFGCIPENFTPTECGFFELVHPDDRMTVRRVSDQSLSHGKYYSVDYRIIRPDGTERQLVQQARIVRNDDGKPVQMIGTVQDITERKRAEESLRVLNEQLEARVQERTRQLEQANRELESFSYSVSHDLQAPVRAINGFVQILREDHHQRMDAEMVRLCEVIASNSRRMGEMIEDLLSFSKLDAHEFRTAPTDMKSLAALVASEQVVAANSAALVRIGELPPASVDESIFRQVFSNLISNALKYSRSNSAPEIEVGARTEGEEVVYFVRDNGVGFDMRYAGKLFKVFQRLHQTEQFEGTGVGLAIVQRVVQRHGGRVWAESAPGRGATFHFALPVPGEPRAHPVLVNAGEVPQHDALTLS